VALDLPKPHRQHGLRAIERLNLRLLVDAEDEACVGGCMYRPMISRTFSISSGSVDSVKLSVRCGWRSNARQICCTVVRPKPLAFAIPRTLQ
jgi:hypothetical protein